MKKITLAISIAAVVAILAGVAAMAYANSGTATTVSPPCVECANSNGADYAPASYAVTEKYVTENNETIIRPLPGWFGGRGMGLGFGRGPRGFGYFEVSQAFKDNVINITKADTDVQKLLADGYNVTQVRPNIKAVVGANGTITIKATTATVTLQKDRTGKATVWVNMEASKVTRIEIFTRTVIEKP